MPRDRSLRQLVLILASFYVVCGVGVVLLGILGLAAPPALSAGGPQGSDAAKAIFVGLLLTVGCSRVLWTPLRGRRG